MFKFKDGMGTPELDVLVVEDNPGDVALIEAALQEREVSLSVQVVHDGESAIAYLKNFDNPRPRLVFLDLNLPGMSGLEVLKTVKSDKRLSTIPMCVLSSSAARDDVRGAYANHANGFVTKPVSLGEFRDVVKALQDFWVRIVRLP